MSVGGVAPRFSWNPTEFVVGDIKGWIRGFATFRERPALLQADVSEGVDDRGATCLEPSTEAIVSRFAARLDDDDVRIRASRDELAARGPTAGTKMRRLLRSCCERRATRPRRGTSKR